jgi:hypothetical protein
LRIMAFRPVAGAPALHNFNIRHQLKIRALAITIKNGEFTPYLPADDRFITRKSGVLFGIHQRLINLMGWGLKGDCLPDGLSFHCTTPASSFDFFDASEKWK